MGVHQYFKRLSDMERLIRLPGKFKYFEHNVAAHSFKVTKIAQYLATVEEYHGRKINWKSLYEKALNHDFAEVFTGDIKTPVKYASSELKKLFSQVEEEMVETFIEEEIPLQYRDVYKQRLQEGKDDSYYKAKYFQLLIKLICFMKHLEKYKNVIPKNYFSKFMK
ncbi:YfbR-like 5'-deoxynucleotidase [Staphylococcus aureus]